MRQFKAQVLHTHGAELEIRQSIVQGDNELNTLPGRFPTTVARNTSILAKPIPQKISAGIHSEVLLGRPDIQQAEMELIAAKADINGKQWWHIFKHTTVFKDGKEELKIFKASLKSSKYLTAMTALANLNRRTPKP